MSRQKIDINEEWFYHRFSSVKLKKIMKSGGLKARKHLSRVDKRSATNGTWNGNHYISLAKRLEGDQTSFKRYIEGEFAFIIDPNLDAIKAKVKDLDSFYEMIAKLPIRKRFAGREGEYQVKGQIPIDKIVGIKIPSGERFFWDTYPKDHNEKELDKILEILDEYNSDLPFIDVERGQIVSRDEIKDYLAKKTQEEKLERKNRK